MLNEKDVTITKRGYFSISKKDFKILRSPKHITIGEFVDICNDLYYAKFGKHFEGSKWRYVSADDRAFYEICHNRWSSINQRCVNGKYTKSSTAVLTPQLLSYRRRGITVDMTYDEFVGWMFDNRATFDLIKSAGEIPSIDRIDNNKGYALDNIRLMALHSNIEARYGKKCKRSDEMDKITSRQHNQKSYEKYVKNILKEI